MFAQFHQFVTDSARRRRWCASLDSVWCQSTAAAARERFQCIVFGDYIDQCTILSPPPSSGQQPNTRLDRSISVAFVRCHGCGILSCVPQHGSKHGRLPLSSDRHDGASSAAATATHSAHSEERKVSVANDRPGRVPAATRQEGF